MPPGQGLQRLPLRIVQVSDIHLGTPTFDVSAMERVIERVNGLEPDLVAVVGDLTAMGRETEFEDAAAWIGRFDAPTLTAMGNHDGRNLGYLHFERLFGPRFTSRRIALDEPRATRLGATGVTVVAVDSSVPDINEGHIGREWYGWIREQYAEPDDLRVFMLHHHLVSIPGTGRERNIVTDAGDLLEVLVELDVGLVLSGHKHVPFFWGLNGLLVINSGTATTRRVRGLTPPSWNEIMIDAAAIKVFTHYEDGRRELSALRSRVDRSEIRAAMTVTDAFRRRNHVSTSWRGTP